MRDNLRIRRGAVRDTDTIIGLIDEAAHWLHGKGTDQWAEPWPSRSARDGRVRRGLRNGNTWIAEAGTQAIATITYRKHGNQKLWTPQEQREPAVYVSRLIVARSAAGLGVGAAMVDWAATQAQRDWNAQWIRIDVWTTNSALHDYYKKTGFRFCRIADFDETDFPAEVYPSAALFQKPTSEIDLAAARSLGIDSGGRKELVGAARA